jgi:hypothetical protein
MEAIGDFCEKVFHFCLLLKIGIFGIVSIYQQFTAVDTIWYEYCNSLQQEKSVRISINLNPHLQGAETDGSYRVEDGRVAEG